MQSRRAVRFGRACKAIRVVGVVLVVACGGAESPPAQTAERATEPSPAPAPPAPSTAAPSEPEPKTSEPKSEPEQSPPPPAKDPNAAREVKYTMTPDGLKIDVAGVRFLASARAKQIGQGWGATVSVKAEANDDKEHVLLNPKRGPLAFAAAVLKSGGGEAERIPDEREGDAEMKLVPGGPVSFSRDFPGKGGRVLAMGETLDLETALWGLGETSDDRRPVKQFFHVKMKVEKGKPKAIVEPPASAGK